MATPADFFDLSPEEARLIDLKLALRACLKEERKKQNVTQVELPRRLARASPESQRWSGETRPLAWIFC